MLIIASCCPLLKKLNLRNLIELTDIGLGYITNGSTMMLEVLDVTKCKFRFVIFTLVSSTFSHVVWKL